MQEDRHQMATRDQADLRAQLEGQYRCLERSAAAFDEGEELEASRLAVVLRLLLRDTRHSKSLLTQIGLKERLEILDTAEPHRGPRERLLTALTYLRVAGNRPVFVARRLGAPASQIQFVHLSYIKPSYVPVEQWLNRVVIAEAGDRGAFTAAQLIGWLADKDGGAHVDPELPQEYEALSRLNSLQVQYASLPWGGATLVIDDPYGFPHPSAESPVPAAVRQLAFEMMWTLHQTFGMRAPDPKPRIEGLEIAYEPPDGW